MSGTGKRCFEKMRAVLPVWLQMTTSFTFRSLTICHTPRATAADRCIVLSLRFGSHVLSVTPAM